MELIKTGMAGTVESGDILVEIEKTEGAGVEIQLDNIPLSYYFEVHSGKMKAYFDTRGIMKTPERRYDFRIIPGFKTPDWAKGAVMYQIYVDRFLTGIRKTMS